jgi:large subunit ribosomal protein L31
MKAEIHPEYQDITIKCSCGNEIQTRSTLSSDINVDVCSKCHPFYTGTQKVRDSGGQIDKFKQRFGVLSSGKKKG